MCVSKCANRQSRTVTTSQPSPNAYAINTLAFMSENIEDAAVSDFLRILDEHRKTCERQGKYVEAQVAKNRLQELKFHEHTRRIEAMRSRQIADRLGVEEAHMLELYQFNEAWDRKIQEYQDNIERLEGNLKVLVCIYSLYIEQNSHCIALGKATK